MEPTLPITFPGNERSIQKEFRYEGSNATQYALICSRNWL